MESFTRLISRTVDEEQKKDDKVISLLIALLALVFYHEVKKSSNHRRLTIDTGNGRSSVIVFNNGGGQPMLSNPRSPPHSPDNVPEIHITFPDEQDDQGRPKSGRVVVVRVGDTTVGLEPLNDEQLPAYEKESSTQFYSVDIEKIGGLKEKEFR